MKLRWRCWKKERELKAVGIAEVSDIASRAAQKRKRRELKLSEEREVEAQRQMTSCGEQQRTNPDLIKAYRFFPMARVYFVALGSNSVDFCSAFKGVWS